MVTAKYTKKELIDNLKRLKIKLGRNPTQRDVKNPTFQPYYRQFGSWANALGAAGMAVPPKGAAKKYSDEHLIGLLKERHKKTGRTPSQREFEKLAGHPNPTTYYHTFGSWNKALRRAGIKPRMAYPIVSQKTRSVVPRTPEPVALREPSALAVRKPDMPAVQKPLPVAVRKPDLPAVQTSSSVAVKEPMGVLKRRPAPAAVRASKPKLRRRPAPGKKRKKMISPKRQKLPKEPVKKKKKSFFRRLLGL